MFWKLAGLLLTTVVLAMLFMYFHKFAPIKNLSFWWEIVFLGLAVASGMIFLWVLILHLKPFT